ncbi:MAG: ORF6C domain-containing protein, partial [Prevotellaceae bacterium]|nr:ORF6C domain-containing protein [Prevotellaceae bacterium]
YNRHISEYQAKQIKDKVDEIATSVPKEKVGEEYKKIWSLLKDKFNVTSYHLIVKEQFDDVIKFLSKLNAYKYRQKARKNNNEKYRKELYGAIYAKVNELKMSKDELYVYVENILSLKKPISSLTDLSDTRLKKIYTKLFNKR